MAEHRLDVLLGDVALQESRRRLPPQVVKVQPVDLGARARLHPLGIERLVHRPPAELVPEHVGVRPVLRAVRVQPSHLQDRVQSL